MQEVQLNGQLKVANLEIEGLKKRVEMEFEFSEKWGGEILALAARSCGSSPKRKSSWKSCRALRMPLHPLPRPKPPTLLRWDRVCHQGRCTDLRSGHRRKCLDILAQVFRHMGWQLHKLPMLVRVDRHLAMVRHSIRLRHPHTSTRDTHSRNMWS